MLSGWQVEEMEADAALRQWEDLNAPDLYEAQMIEVSKELSVPLSHLDKVIDSLMDAEAWLDGTPMQPMIGSYLDQVEDIIFSLKQLQDNWRRGIRD